MNPKSYNLNSEALLFFPEFANTALEEINQRAPHSLDAIPDGPDSDRGGGLEQKLPTQSSNVRVAVDVVALEAMVMTEASAILGGESPDRDAPLMASGLDSLSAVELRSALASNVGFIHLRQ